MVGVIEESGAFPGWMALASPWASPNWFGDPGRVAKVASRWDTVDLERSNREITTATGTYRGMRVSCMSTGMGPDNVEHTPVVIHRALLGSLERFIGIIVEHYGGAFPFWLAPVQARLIPVGESHREAVHDLQRRLEADGFRVDVDERDDTLGKRIRDSELEKIPFTIVYGDREAEAARAWREYRSLAVRERGGEQSTMSLPELLERFSSELARIEA